MNSLDEDIYCRSMTTQTRSTKKCHLSRSKSNSNTDASPSAWSRHKSTKSARRIPSDCSTDSDTDKPTGDDCDCNPPKPKPAEDCRKPDPPTSPCTGKPASPPPAPKPSEPACGCPPPKPKACGCTGNCDRIYHGCTIKTFLKMVFHFGMAWLFAYALFYEANQMMMPRDIAWAHRSYGGRWKYLTYWNLILMILFLAVSGMVDFAWLIYCNTDCFERTFLRRRDFYYATILAPLSFFLVTSFWVIYYLDRELIYPVRMDFVVPTWLNLTMHLMPLVVCLIDMRLYTHHYPTRYEGIVYLLGFAFTFLLWIVLASCINNNLWAYPILNVMVAWEWVLFFLQSADILVASYIIMEIINDMIVKEQNPICTVQQAISSVSVSPKREAAEARKPKRVMIDA